MILPPFTKVPLREPRSRTHHVAPKRSNTACTRETPSASTTTSFDSSVPTVMRSEFSARSSRPLRPHTSTKLLIANQDRRQGGKRQPRDVDANADCAWPARRLEHV